MKNISLFLFCISLVFSHGYLDAQNQMVVNPGTDIRMAPNLDINTQCEVHISIDKNHPNNLILTANTYDQTLSYAEEGYYYSNNGGATWNGSDDFPNAGTVTCGLYVFKLKCTTS